MTLRSSSDTEVEEESESVQRGWGLGKGPPFPSFGGAARSGAMRSSSAARRSGGRAPVAVTGATHAALDAVQLERR